MYIIFKRKTQFGTFIKTADIQSNISDEDIKAMFTVVMGVSFDENCSYEIKENKKLYEKKN